MSEDASSLPDRAALQRELDEARAELAFLRGELQAAHRALAEHPAALLREANERLVVSALQALQGADTARSDLDHLTVSSQRDSLTGIPNRALMLDRLESAIALAQRRGTRLALLFVDLDDFKQINDTLGHAAGDSALRGVAGCLSAAVRHSDTVSRHGGDEFLVLLAEVAAASDVAQVAAKILSSLQTVPGLPPPAPPLSASVGIALFPDDGTLAAALIDRADAAMYRAKQAGPGRFAFHSAPAGSWTAARQAGDRPA